ncbi:hypothetical protein G6O69_34040 [Pseudenhygromyxa sp. WMMC2535]|uniref:hypothetical protein n=1 Tax=Pseudenhygromyxa sp. WMMC2535 TaxID=2712867 RepID=UPI0015570296|nr:hypothetical protein [Pseudenhygromyxa sp. WMMC2535]NVB42892.1 hypothetical protein [Pseudenhygromyxa sp. WMMC2535]
MSRDERALEPTRGAGPRRAALSKVAIGAALVATMDATGCASAGELTRPAALAEEGAVAVDALSKLLWPAGVKQRWAASSEDELRELEALVDLLMRRAEQGELRRGEARRALAMAARVGLELSSVETQAGQRRMQLWMLREAGERRRGLGAYLIRRGPLGVRGDELILQAPHPFFDRHTGVIALHLFLEQGASRALFVGSIHRYRRADGSKRRDPAGDNPADPAHSLDHPFARVSATLLRRRKIQLIQLHGFARDAEAGEPEIIVSAGSELPNHASAAVEIGLLTALESVDTSHYGISVERLGGTTNVQGRAARAAKRCFVHIELSEGLRERLLSEAWTRARFGRALFEASEKEGARGCR